MVETYFIWDFATAILFLVAGLCMWLMGKIREVRQTKMDFRLLGFAVVISSGFTIGFYSLLLACIYWLIVWSWDYNRKTYIINIKR